VAGACLFAFSLRQLKQFDAGIQRDRLMVVDVDPTEAGYKDEQLIQLNMRLRDRLASIPGVESVSFSQNGIYSFRNFDTTIEADGFHPANKRNSYAVYDHVGPGFFTTLGTKLIAGRDFTDRDDRGAPNAVILSRTLARRVFKDENPIGHNFYAYDQNGK